MTTLTYAGIGTRKTTVKESEQITRFSTWASRESLWLHSGNAKGADSAFLDGVIACENHSATIFLPWPSFGFDHHDLGAMNIPHSYKICDEAQRSVDRFHPNPKALRDSGKDLMARNYYQVMGQPENGFSQSSFVLCCASISGLDQKGRTLVEGGTGQAVRIAHHYNIPVFNIRELGWKPKLIRFLETKLGMTVS